MSRFRRLLFPVAAAMLFSACLSLTDGFEFPANAIVYKIDPALLSYTFVDQTVQGGFSLAWLPVEPYIGINCIGLVPKSAQDTSGTFVFGYYGPNTGRIERRTVAGITDTTTGYFLPATAFSQGTHGTYAVDQTGRLKLFWADGTQTRYFDAGADIRLFGDTIRAVADTRSNADSIRAQWTVYWTFDDVC